MMAALFVYGVGLAGWLVVGVVTYSFAELAFTGEREATERREAARILLFAPIWPIVTVVLVVKFAGTIWREADLKK